MMDDNVSQCLTDSFHLSLYSSSPSWSQKCFHDNIDQFMLFVLTMFLGIVLEYEKAESLPTMITTILTKVPNIQTRCSSVY